METQSVLFGGINVHSSEPLVCVYRDKGNKSVKLLSRIFIFIALAVETDSDAVLDVTNATFPHCLVQA